MTSQNMTRKGIETQDLKVASAQEMAARMIVMLQPLRLQAARSQLYDGAASAYQAGDLQTFMAWALAYDAHFRQESPSYGLALEHVQDSQAEALWEARKRLGEDTYTPTATLVRGLALALNLSSLR